MRATEGEDRFVQLTRTAGKKARFSAGRARGLYARGRQIVVRPTVETVDAVIEQRIRSEALRDVGIPASDIEPPSRTES